MDGRRIAIGYIDAHPQGSEEGEGRADRWFPFSYGAHRVLTAAVVAFPDREARMFRGEEGRAAELAEEIERFDPDVFGASCYVWSFATLVETARLLKQRRPDRLIVLGGPCAHPSMFGLPPFAPLQRYVDVLVTREGETVFPNLLRLPRHDPASLLTVPGAVVRTPFGFREAPGGRITTPLDQLPSPFRHGTAPSGVTAHLEVFRGCPLSCAFCEWGVPDDATRVVSTEWLIEEFETLRRIGTQSVFMVDAGLNLNGRAFRNLVAAERETRLLRDVPIGFEIYPDYVRPEHIEFLSECHVHHAGVGLQTANPETLRLMQRKFDEEKFRRGVAQLMEVAECTLEIIFGLPGDSPESFWRTVDVVMSLGDNVRCLAYHTLVLPDGLMTRAPEGSNMEFDPYTLRMQSCWGWSRRDLEETKQRLADMALRSGDLWYMLGPPDDAPGEPPGDPGARTSSPGAHGQRPGRVAEVRSDERGPRRLDETLAAALAGCVRDASGGAWQVTEAARQNGGLVVRLTTGGGALQLDARRAEPARPSYKVVGGLAWSYRHPGGDVPRALLAVLDRALDGTQAIAPELLGALQD